MCKFLTIYKTSLIINDTCFEKDRKEFCFFTNKQPTKSDLIFLLSNEIKEMRESMVERTGDIYNDKLVSVYQRHDFEKMLAAMNSIESYLIHEELASNRKECYFHYSEIKNNGLLLLSLTVKKVKLLDKISIMRGVGHESDSDK